VTTPRPPYRVIQWGTGAVGAEMITAILDHRTDLALVGAKVYTDGKHGKDVGVLAGRDPLGVFATADSAEALAIEADRVLYTPRTAHLDEVCSILTAGKNVVTTVPAVCDAAPGFATTATLPLVRSHTGFGHG